MATTSKINSNNRRKELTARHEKLRTELRTVMKSLKATDEEKAEAQKKLQKLPRNSNKTRIRNRCALTGRPRAYMRRFGLCRIKFRELALTGQIPGVTKSSW